MPRWCTPRCYVCAVDMLTWNPSSRYSAAMSDLLTVEELAPGDAESWDAFAEQHGAATVYHLARWRDVIAHAFGHPTHYLLARDATRQIVGVMPIARINSRLFGHYMVSLPYFTYGGPLGKDSQTIAALTAAACKIGKQFGCKHLEVREQSPPQHGWAVREDKVSMVLPLAGTEEGLWKQLSSQRRSQIRKAQAAGPEVCVGGAQLLDDFYAVFARNMRDLGTPVYGRIFFETMLATFPENIRIVSVRLNGTAVGAAFLIGFRDSMEVPWVSTIREHNAQFMNTLLYWEILNAVQKLGYRNFDFGRSTKNAGTYQFKKQWGAKPRQLFWSYWLAEGAKMPNLTPQSGKFKLAVRVWQRLPLPLANCIGPVIVKDLP